MTANRPPNILLFIPDAMQAQVTFPEHDCRTPNIDRVAARGLRFSRAYCALPTCSPSRASLMTGRLPHNHGVLQVEHCTAEDQCVLRDQLPHWAQHLAEAGYRTGYFGKWHIEPDNRVEDFGWQVNGTDATAAYRALGAGVAPIEELVRDNSPACYQSGPEGYNRILHYGVTDVPANRRRFAVTTDLASEFLREVTQEDRPWACCVSTSEPNTPLIAGRSAFDMYDVDAIRLPESLRDEMHSKPAFYRRQREIFARFTDRDWQATRACYYALITELDAQLGRLLDMVEQAGQMDNTVVAILSDHGRYMGAHGFDAHNFGAFEEAYNVPLVIAGPGIACGAVTDAPVSLMDLGPTLLDLAGAQPLGAPDSKSLAPLLADPAGRRTDYDTCYAEYFGTRFWLTQRVLWKDNWKLVFNGFDYDELYDLENDPHELTNRASDPDCRHIYTELMTDIWRIAHRTGDTALLETHYPPMRFGIVGPNAGARTHD